MYLGDFAPGVTIHHLFTSIDDEGAPIVLTGSPAIVAYKDASDTQDTDGLSISASADSVTGLNRIAIDTSTDGTFYSAGSSFHIVLSAGTVDGVSVVGYVVCSFTLGRSAAYGRLGAPAGASVSADVAAIKAQTAAIETDTQDLQTQVGVDGAGLTNMPWNASWDTEVQSEVQDAIEVNHLDHLLAQAYDPSSKPGSGTALLNVLVENDGGTPRFTANSLEEAPTGGGGSETPLAEGTAQAGAASTITLQSDEPTTADLFNLCLIELDGGTGAGQSRQITDYSTGRVATVNEPWAVVPDNTTTYRIKGLGILAATLLDVENAIWDAERANHQLAGSFGEYVFSDMILLSGDPAAADNLEALVDGTGLTLTNVVVPWNAAWDAEVQSEVADALAVYDPPTNAEMEARTLVAANYATAAALTTVGDNVITIDGIVDDILTDTGTTLDDKINTIDNVVDGIASEVTAIKAKTDGLTYSDPGVLDVSVKVINATPVAGGSGEPWRRGS